MAKATGGDLLVRLVGEIDALREEFRGTSAQVQRHSVEIQRIAVEVQQTTYAFKQHAKRVDGHLLRVARLISALADQTERRFLDHEERIQALEAG